VRGKTSRRNRGVSEGIYKRRGERREERRREARSRTNGLSRSAHGHVQPCLAKVPDAAVRKWNECREGSGDD